MKDVKVNSKRYMLNQVYGFSSGAEEFGASRPGKQSKDTCNPISHMKKTVAPEINVPAKRGGP